MALVLYDKLKSTAYLCAEWWCDSIQIKTNVSHFSAYYMALGAIPFSVNSDVQKGCEVDGVVHAVWIVHEIQSSRSIWSDHEHSSMRTKYSMKKLAITWNSSKLTMTPRVLIRLAIENEIHQDTVHEPEIVLLNKECISNWHFSNKMVIDTDEDLFM